MTIRFGTAWELPPRMCVPGVSRAILAGARNENITGSLNCSTFWICDLELTSTGG